MNFTNTTPFHLSFLRKKNVWYTISDGAYNDPSIWSGNAAQAGNIPGIKDDVYINHVVTFDGQVSYSVNNLFVTGVFNMKQTNPYGSSINVFGNIKVTGSLNMTSLSVVTLNLYGIDNYFASLTPGNTSVINYVRNGDQNIAPAPYFNVGVYNAGTKYLTSNLTITGTMTTVASTSTVEFGSYNFSGGFSNNGKLSKTGSGSVVFNSLGTGGVIRFATGNPTIEFTGTLGATMRVIAPDWQLGTGDITISTTSQFWRILVGSITLNNNIYIKGNINFTNQTEGGNTSIINLTGGKIDGVKILPTDNPTFSNSGYLNIYSSSITFMTTAGTYNYNATSDSNIGYLFAGNYTLPYTTYSAFRIDGGGIKSISGSLSVSVSANVANGELALGNYDANFGGLSMAGLSSKLTKSGAGNVIFSNSTLGSFGGGGVIDFTGGNPTVEFQGGFRFAFMTYLSGTGQHKFTTRNQTFRSIAGANTFNCNVLVSGAITVIHGNETGGNASDLTVTGTITGDNAASTFDNQAVLRLTNATEPMAATGVFKNTFIAGSSTTTQTHYSLNGNQNIKGGTYYDLILETGGVKKLMANVSVTNTYTLTGPATLNSNGFALTNP